MSKTDRAPVMSLIKSYRTSLLNPTGVQDTPSLHELPRERLAGRLRKVGGSPSYFSAHSHSEKSTIYAQKAVILQKLSLGELQSQV